MWLMKNLHMLIFCLSFLIYLQMSGCNPQKEEEKKIETSNPENEIKAPIAAKNPYSYTVNQLKITDNYYWLRDRENPEVIAYLQAENAYTDKVMQHTEALQQELFNELKQRIDEDDSSYPVKHGNYYYYYRTEKDKQYPLYCRKKGSLESAEQVVLDLNILAEGQPYFSLGSYKVSPDHQMLAYTTDTVGNENYSLYIKNMNTRELMEEPISGLSYSVEWANDNQTIFYTTRDDAYRPYKLFRHKLGTSYTEDKLVFHEEDDRFFLSVAKSKNNAYLLLYLKSKTTSEVHLINANEPNEAPKVFAPRVPDVEYTVYPHSDHFYILTNLEAVNYRVMRAEPQATAIENWQEVVPQNDSTNLERIEEFKNYLAIFERVNGLTQIKILPFDEMTSYTVQFEDPAYTLYESNNPDFSAENLRFIFTSLKMPREVISYNMKKKTKTVLKVDKVLGGYDPDNYISERIFATAKDGTAIPISLVYKKDLKINGQNPLYLYGYGAYGITTDPVFNPNRISLLDRGFVFAMAHIRGSSDMGELWYKEGKLLNKKNTFTDFIACGEHLVAKNYTNKKAMVAMGGSAGGLLMGAVANMRPDLFEIIIAKVPFVDVINTMMDESLPLTITEYEEWGNPHELQYFEYIHSYSPYENVEAHAYPHLLVTAGLNDPRVSYWEPAKWVAKLRNMKTNDTRLLLKTNMEAGHGGASGRHDYLKEIAFEYAFIFDLLL